jgi:hypothetical protein
MKPVCALQRVACMLAMTGLFIAAIPAAAEPGPSVRMPIPEIEARLRGPLDIVGMEQARPTIDGDRSARIELAGQDGQAPMPARWKPVAPPGEGFNNEPRYELAAYQLQKMFLEECEYVVPPVVLRALSAEEYRQKRGPAPQTVRGTGSVIFILSYWLSDVTPKDPWDAQRFATDPRYARHFAHMNLLTHLIDHKDSNPGNVLLSTYPADPRVFAVDNDVAFDSTLSDRGELYRGLLVDRLPRQAVERLQRIKRGDLNKALGVLAEFRTVEGTLVAAEPGPPMSRWSGVRSGGGRVQFGLTDDEIRATMRRISRLLAQVKRGRITLVEDTPESIGLACAGAASR